MSGRNFVQVGLRGYWPSPEVLRWMAEQGLRWHLMTEIEERGAEAVIDAAIGEALDGADSIYLSVDIDVVDPGMAPGTGTPEPGGLLPRELLRAVRRIVSAVELAGMDVVEVSPPYDWAESTASRRAVCHSRAHSSCSFFDTCRPAQRLGITRAALDFRNVVGREPTPATAHPAVPRSRATGHSATTSARSARTSS